MQKVTVYLTGFASLIYTSMPPAFFVSVEDEVHTLELMNRILSDGKRLCIPYITEPDSRIMTAALVNNLDDLVPGFWDIPTVRQDKYHEVKPDDIDLVIVPGAAFDKQGHRIGMMYFCQRYAMELWWPWPTAVS